MLYTHSEKTPLYLVISILIILSIFGGCIGDDIIFDEIEPVVRINNPIDTIEIGATYQFTYSYLDEIGATSTPASLSWKSSDSDIIEIMDDGIAVAREIGEASVILEAQTSSGIIVTDENRITVGSTTVISNGLRTGEIQTTSSYKLTGAFTIEAQGNDLEINFGDDYEASTSLPGLYVYLTNNPNTINNALEIGAVEIFKGPHSYSIKDVGINDYSYLLYYCKPFVVKVGDGKISE